MTESRFRYAGFWRRAVAILLDGIILGAGMGVINSILFLDEGTFLLVQLVAGWLYMALMQSSPSQATLGKQALGIKVTDLEGYRISFARATGRYFAKNLSALILFIGFIMVAFNPKKQGLHDIIAGTLVIKK